MKKTFLAAGLVVVFGTGLVGCKTTPKLAFWKKDAAADTALASSAPALPSDLAKQGTAAASTVAQARTTEAAPFVPGQIARTSATAAAPANYPSTDAPPFTPDVATRIASAATPAPAPTRTLTSPISPSSHLGSIAAAPYNPSATPAPTTPQAPATPSAGDSRYAGAAAPSAPLYGQPAIGAMAGMTANAATPPGSANPLADAPTYGAQARGDRYGSPATPTVGAAGGFSDVASASATVPVAQGVTPQGATPQGAVAAVATTAAQPYRPGGTSTYSSSGTLPGSEPTARLASRPQETSTAPAASGATVPNVARPSGAGVTTPATTPQGRYW